ncbi:MAG: DegT/DnrJ/EryC1/StrS family aminotransferase [Spirochaetales bacterium]|nr:DegT/DnrJ/EryC1/StrS family aminotransferase [Spirochaetales bacterium]
MDAVLTRLVNDAIGVGAVSREFSLAVAKYLGRRTGVSMRTYRAALSASLHSLGLAPGARIGVSALARGAVWRTIEECDYIPIAVDTQKQIPVLPSPLDFDYQGLAISALFVDTRLGYICDLDHLKELRLPIIEDVSEGLGGNTGSAMAGELGDVTMVGLEPDHIITAGGGTAVVTNGTKRLSQLSSWADDGRGESPLPDMNAALGLTQLRQIEKFVERRRELTARFLRTVQRGRHSVPLQDGEVENVFSALPVRLESSPREVEQYAREHGVSADRAFHDTVLTLISGGDESAEGDMRDDSTETGEDAGRSFPNAVALASRMVVFPLFPTLSKGEQDKIERVLATMP